MKNEEHYEQVAVIHWALYHENKYPELKLLYAVPNGGRRSIGVAKKLKAEGVKRGVPDLCLPVARAGCHGLYIEMKTKKEAADKKLGIKGSYPSTSKEQKEYLQLLREQGYATWVAYGADDAIVVLENYLKGIYFSVV